MSRLLVHVEGHTEESFVQQVLRDHLASRGYDSIEARLLGNSGQRARRGGIRRWDAVKAELLGYLKRDRRAIRALMVDYYALPGGDRHPWPGLSEARKVSEPIKRSTVLCEALLEEISAAMGKQFDRRRFIPFVVIHEFEGLLFSDCKAFSDALFEPDLLERLQKIRDQFDTPEDIDDGPETAPSKRLLGIHPQYRKVLDGIGAAERIGLPRIRQECKAFDEWIGRLEAAAGA